MFFRILKHDLRKKKMMNVLILLFIVLATIFSASGLNNIVTVMNGTDYYFDKAGLGNYFIISKKDDTIFEILDNNDNVIDYKFDENYLGSKNNIEVDGKQPNMSVNTIFFQPLEFSSLKFFNKNDEEITRIEKGKVYITGNMLKENNLKEGDKVTIVLGNEKLDLEIAGKAKDALLGSKFMGNIRFLMNREDYRKIENASKEANLEKCNIFYVNAKNDKEMAKSLSDASLIFFNGTSSKIKLSYVMDMIVAFIILVLSVCLVILALLILKFTITFTINEEYREIGVMKAIGINNGNIRKLYIIKYLSLAIAGAFIGFLISIPFGKMLIDSSAQNMVLGNTAGAKLNLAGSVFVIFITILFAYIYTKKVKKATPVDAIRNGQTGERYKRKTLYKMEKSHIRLNSYLAVNDILSSPKKFFTIIVSFFVCLVFILGIVITTDTMKSKNLITTFGTKSDLYFSSSDALDAMGFKNKEEFNETKVKEYKQLLEQNGMPCDIVIDLLYKNKITFKGETYKLTVIQGLNTKATDYEYSEGTAPVNSNEIALAEKISNNMGAKVGDTVAIDLGAGEQEYIVTARFQTLLNQGEVIRLNENAPTDFSCLSGSGMYQINFKDNPNDKEILNRKERVKEILNIEDVYTAEEFSAKTIGVVDTMESVQYLLLTITIIVVILVILLMELSFVTDEKSQIALLKAIGFKDSQIIKWHVYRFAIATIIAEILGVALALPITRLWCNPIFGMMGTNKVNYFVNPMHVFLIYPGIVLVASILVALLATLTTKKIKSSDTANIE